MLAIHRRYQIEESLNHIRQYILDNPLRWAMDRENPDAVEPEPEEAWRS